ncbi:MAG: hypothetical protein AB8F94_22845 [Saprospiraceae bacterium]
MCRKKLIEELKAENKKECFENKLTAEENGRKFTIKLSKNSQEEFCRIKVDGCFVKDKNVEKCDFAFHRCSNDDKYFVELKGIKIKKGFNQIVKTITTHLPSPKEKNYGFIVASRVPRSGVDINKLKIEFRKKYGMALKIQTRQIIHQV